MSSTNKNKNTIKLTPFKAATAFVFSFVFTWGGFVVWQGPVTKPILLTMGTAMVVQGCLLAGACLVWHLDEKSKKWLIKHT